MEHLCPFALAVLAAVTLEACPNSETDVETAPVTTFENAEVRTAQGVVDGVVEEDVAIFRGLPFAAPPR